MGILSFIGDIFKPAADLVDELHVSDEERLTLRNKLAEIQANAQAKMIELEQAKVEAQMKIQVAEQRSGNWLSSSWRPLASLAIVTLIILGSFGVVTVTQDIYDLASVFLTGYAGARGAEKIASVIKFGGK